MAHNRKDTLTSCVEWVALFSNRLSRPFSIFRLFLFPFESFTAGIGKTIQPATKTV
jgi:hypothetical protein